MEIKVIGTGCDDCARLYENTLEAVEELGIDATVEKVEDLIEIVKLGVMSVPSLMVDGKLLVKGKVASKAKLLELLN